MTDIKYTQAQLDGMSADELKQLLIDEVPSFNKQIQKEEKIRAAAAEAFLDFEATGVGGGVGEDDENTDEGSGDGLADALASAMGQDPEKEAKIEKPSIGEETPLGLLLTEDEVMRRQHERRNLEAARLRGEIDSEE